MSVTWCARCEAVNQQREVALMRNLSLTQSEAAAIQSTAPGGGSEDAPGTEVEIGGVSSVLEP